MSVASQGQDGGWKAGQPSTEDTCAQAKLPMANAAFQDQRSDGSPPPIKLDPPLAVSIPPEPAPAPAAALAAAAGLKRQAGEAARAHKRAMIEAMFSGRRR